MRLLTLLVAAFVSQADTRYVSMSGDNGNTGMLGDPWRDIQFGADQLQAGDELRVLAGTYAEKVVLTSSHSGIRLVSENAIIDGSSLVPLGREGLITLSGASDVSVLGFTLQDFSTSDGVEINDTPVGILIVGSGSNLTIENNIIRGIANRSTCGQSSGCGIGANGIGIYGTTAQGLRDISLRNNLVENCILAASEAFTMNGNIDGFEVIGNTVRNNNNIGLDFIGYESNTCPACSPEENRARNGYVAFNHAVGNSTNRALGGFPNNPWYEGTDGSAGGFYVDGGHHLYFEGNFSSDNDLGFEFASEMPGRSTHDIVMASNVIVGNRELGLAMGGYDANPNGPGGGSADRLWIINNSFYKNRGWGTEWVFQYRVSDATLLNNVVFTEGDTGDSIEQSEIPGATISSNIWWGDTANGTGLIPSGEMVVDPALADTTTLLITPTSPAIDIATPPGFLTTWTAPFWVSRFGTAIPLHGTRDSSGELRLEGVGLDIGADEFGMSLVDRLFGDGFES